MKFSIHSDALSHFIYRNKRFVVRREPNPGKKRPMHMNKKHISPFRSAVRFTGAYVPLYHADTVNHCPSCGHTHWHIGRATAECAFCETAIPLAAVSAQPTRPLFWSRSTETIAA